MAREMLDTLRKKVDPAHAALVVVDMQNDFCARNGVMDQEGADLSLVQAMAPRLSHLLEEARAVRLPIIFIQSVYDRQPSPYLSDVWMEQQKRRGRKGYVQVPMCGPGSWGGDFYRDIRPAEGDLVVHKHRYSAFIDTDLDLVLRSLGVRTVLMTGVGTNVCVESTARDAFMNDYYVVFLKDCTATYSTQAHEGTLQNIDRFFGQVVTSDEVIACWVTKAAAVPR